MLPLGLALMVACKQAPTTPVPTDTDAIDTDVPVETDTDVPPPDTGPGVIGCEDDPLEPNDTPSTAIASTGEADVVVCVDSDDYWAIDVPAGGAVDVSITFEHALGDIDASLRREGGQQVDNSESLNDVETLSWVNETGSDETVVVRVHLFSVVSGPSNAYDFEATVCVDDTDEPNDTLDDATASGTHTGQALVFGNDDWYAIEVPAGEVATVVLDHTPDADLDLTLWEQADPAPNELAGNSIATSPEQVQWANTTDGPVTVYARVAYWSGSEGTCADYDLTTTTAPLACPDDAREPNDDIDSALPALAPPGEADLTVSLVDEDFIALDLPGGSVTEVALTADPPGSVALEVLNANEDVVASGTPVVLGSGSRTAHLSIVNGVCSTYGLELVDLTPDCTPDASEPDDTLGDAGPIADGDATVGPDVDIATVSLGAGEAVAVVVDADPRLGSIQLSWSEDGSLAQAAVGPGRVAVGRPNPGAASNAVVQIEADEALGACLPYTVETVRQACGDNDALEPNDLPLDAMSLPNPSGISELLLANGELDYFALDVDPGASVEVEVGFLHVLGDIDVRLITPLGVVLDTSSSVDDQESVSWTNPGQAVQPVLLEVSHATPPGCTTPYTVELQ